MSIFLSKENLQWQRCNLPLQRFSTFNTTRTDFLVLTISYRQPKLALAQFILITPYPRTRHKGYFYPFSNTTYTEATCSQTFLQPHLSLLLLHYTYFLDVQWYGLPWAPSCQKLVWNYIELDTFPQRRKLRSRRI